MQGGGGEERICNSLPFHLGGRREEKERNLFFLLSEGGERSLTCSILSRGIPPFETYSSKGRGRKCFPINLPRERGKKNENFLPIYNLARGGRPSSLCVFSSRKEVVIYYLRRFPLIGEKKRTNFLFD